ncbi:HNH endonuclease signature motif containing protein [Nocardioides dongkuii]|uniref:HNH endonuclease signature motif containing protein n=1 Tax=Nocardioides dongkuii TaxID=2760089 RepID=UPI0015FB4CE9|nr:HNH endonuclease signature motif containing protein [Nocardioides dongkuii]
MTADLRPTRHHPVSAAVARLHAELDDLADVALFGLDQDETAETLRSLTTLSARVAELELRVALQADRHHCGDRTGATDTATWWAVETGQTRPVAKARLRLARDLEQHEPTAAALREGHLVVDQARAITDAVDALPDDLDPALVARAEQHLLIEALDHDAHALRLLGKRLLTVLAPEIGEERDARALEREERAARESAWLTLCHDGQGSTVGKFKIPALHGAMLRKMLLAFAAPKHQTAIHGADSGADSAERRPAPERMGDPFCELLERLPADQLPQLGGLNASLVLTMDHTGLLDGLRPAVLDDGTLVSAATARRLACEAGLIPAVLGTDSEVLDLGRTARLFPRALRIALNLAQPTCTAEGCDWPAYLCHSHHDESWADGGPTDLANARNLCPRHHARIHDPAYETSRLASGEVRFHRRT